MVSFEKTEQRTEAFSTLHSIAATENTRDGGVSASNWIVAKYILDNELFWISEQIVPTFHLTKV